MVDSTAPLQPQVFIFLGPGGVGKTSTSIAWAYKEAKKGKKVGLLSIDPARRLAQALGLSLNDHKPKRIYHQSGWIDALMIDPKYIFDEMVFRHSKNEKDAKLIMNHPLYQSASTQLAGSLEYMALAKLDDMIQSKSYDLIILDTPPDAHALEFLCRPSLLGHFVDSKVLPWLIKPFHKASGFGLGKLFFAGEKLMGGLAKITGFDALKLVAEFLVLMQQAIQGFYQSSQRIKNLLENKDQTSFFMITVPQDDRVQSALGLYHELISLGYRLSWVIINRCLPLNVQEELQKAYNEKTKNPSLWKIMEDLYERKQEEQKSFLRLKKEIEKNNQNENIHYSFISESLKPVDSESEIWRLTESEKIFS